MEKHAPSTRRAIETCAWRGWKAKTYAKSTHVRCFGPPRTVEVTGLREAADFADQAHQNWARPGPAPAVLSDRPISERPQGWWVPLTGSAGSWLGSSMELDLSALVDPPAPVPAIFQVVVDSSVDHHHHHGPASSRRPRAPTCTPEVRLKVLPSSSVTLALKPCQEKQLRHRNGPASRRFTAARKPQSPAQIKPHDESGLRVKQSKRLSLQIKSSNSENTEAFVTKSFPTLYCALSNRQQSFWFRV